NKAIRKAISWAYQNNHANVEVLCEEGTDLSNEIWRLQSKGVIRLLSTPLEYKTHFIIFKLTDGSTQVLIEGSHNKTEWIRTSSGQLQIVHESKARLFYIPQKRTPRLLTYLQYLYGYCRS